MSSEQVIKDAVFWELNVVSFSSDKHYAKTK